MEISFSFLY